MNRILISYEEASDQAINFNKSEISFSRNVNDDSRANLSNILGVQACLGTGNYLGLPSMIGRSKKSVFNYIKDKVWRKINSWSGKSLSKADR